MAKKTDKRGVAKPSPVYEQRRGANWPALAIAAVHIFVLVRYHRNTSGFQYLPVPEHLPVSECSFYYSFYDEVVKSDDGAVVAALRLARDPRTEAPDTINALARFNIWPEVIVAMLYRGLTMIAGPVCAPFDFYIYVLLALFGAGLGALARLAQRLAGEATIAAVLVAAVHFLLT